MKIPLIVSLVALMLAAVGIVMMILNRPSAGPRTFDPVLPTAAVPNAEWLARVEGLFAENRELRERLASLELRPAVEQRAPVTDAFVSREEFDAFRDEVLAARSATRALASVPEYEATEAELEDFTERVAGALTEIRKQNTIAKFDSREDRTRELDESMPKIEEWLGLSAQQSERMRTALLVQYEREADLIRRWEEGEDPELLGTMKQSDRELLREELGEILTPEQLETFTSRARRRGGGYSK